MIIYFRGTQKQDLCKRKIRWRLCLFLGSNRVFDKKINFFMFLNCFDVIVLKINFKK
jgi:hypothetical protein